MPSNGFAVLLRASLVPLRVRRKASRPYNYAVTDSSNRVLDGRDSKDLYREHLERHSAPSQLPSPLPLV